MVGLFEDIFQRARRVVAVSLVFQETGILAAVGGLPPCTLLS